MLTAYSGEFKNPHRAVNDPRNSSGTSSVSGLIQKTTNHGRYITRDEKQFPVNVRGDETADFSVIFYKPKGHHPIADMGRGGTKKVGSAV